MRSLNMSGRQLAEIGLGLLGVWALLSAVATFVQIAGVVGASLARVALAEVLPVALLLGLSYLLIFHNGKVATAIFPDVDTGSDARTDNDAPDLARTLVALMGVLLLVEATPSALNLVLNLISVGDADPAFRSQLRRRLLGALVPIAAGVYLIARPGRLIEYLRRPAPEHATAGD